MKPAVTYPASRSGVRLLTVDSDSGRAWEQPFSALPRILDKGDLLVVNDAATVPASLQGTADEGEAIEVRLCGREPDGTFSAVLFGAGDWHTRTEDRPPPPLCLPGAHVHFHSLRARVAAVSTRSPRLVRLRFLCGEDELWAALYRAGRPIQYAHLAHDLPLWAVQTVYAGAPAAFEMPSAGRPLSWGTLLSLRQAGVGVAALTHAAGLSATGDPALDAALPLPERYDIPAATITAVTDTRRRGNRVVAVGTTVVRALEGAAQQGLRAGPGLTSLKIGPAHHLQVVGGVLSGMHAPGENHFELLSAFADHRALASAAAFATEAGFHSHELGDALLVAPRLARTSSRSQRAA